MAGWLIDIMCEKNCRQYFILVFTLLKRSIHKPVENCWSVILLLRWTYYIEIYYRTLLRLGKNSTHSQAIISANIHPLLPRSAKVSLFSTRVSLQSTQLVYQYFPSKNTFFHHHRSRRRPAAHTLRLNRSSSSVRFQCISTLLFYSTLIRLSVIPAVRHVQ